MAIILTTHYMDEADQLCSRIAIIDRGKIVAMDSPEGLKESLGGDLLELATPDPKHEFLERLRSLEDVKNISAQDGKVLLTVKNGESLIPKVFETAQAFSVRISSVSLRKPNLEDVFIKLTGREIRDEVVTEPTGASEYLCGRESDEFCRHCAYLMAQGNQTIPEEPEQTHRFYGSAALIPGCVGERFGRYFSYRSNVSYMDLELSACRCSFRRCWEE